MLKNLNLMSNKKKLAGVLLVAVPIAIFLVSLVAAILGRQNNSALLSFFGFLSVFFGLLSLLSLPLGILLIISSARETKFSIKEATSFGYAKMKENFWFFVGVIIIYFLIYFSPALLEKIKTALNQDNTLFKILFVLFFIIIWLVQIIINIGLLKIALSVVDCKDKKLSDLFSGATLFLNFIIASILYGLIVIGGLILLIIPGLIWQVKFSLFPYFIIEGYGPIESLKKSGQITNGAKIEILLLSLLFGLINILGTMLLFVGLFVTMPITIIGTVYVYRKLANSSPQEVNI